LVDRDGKRRVRYSFPRHFESPDADLSGFLGLFMKLTTAVTNFLQSVDAVLREEACDEHTLERVARMKEEILDPVTRALAGKPRFAHVSRHMSALHKAVEEYVVWFRQEPARRAERRKAVEAAKRRLREAIGRGRDGESEIERFSDDIRTWQWRTDLDSKGRLVYATGSGAVIPGRGAIARDVGVQVIEQACKATRPYSDRLRPRDMRGEPGGLVIIEDVRRAIVVGDLHGRYDNLEHILRDKNNLADIMAGDAHLIFTGDAVHPRFASVNNPAAYEDSFCVMLLIMTLKAENPFNVHYLIGNHDHAHVGGARANRGSVPQDVLFEKYAVEKFGSEVFGRYRQFVQDSPITAKLKAPNGWLLIVHAGLTPRVLSEQGLVNIFIKGRQGPEIQELLWSRNYDRATMEKCLSNLNAKFIIAGHTNPTKDRESKYGITVIAEGVFAHVHDLQVVLNAQRNVFGYMDIDLTRELPEKVTDLRAPDGRPAFRMLRPKGAENNGP